MCCELSQLVCNVNGAISVTGRGDPQDCETSRLPHFPGNWHTDGGEDVSLALQPVFTRAGTSLVIICVKGWADTRAVVRLEGLGKWKNSMTS
jgi:hypothetical protein